MLVLVTYDVSVTEPGGARRLRRVAKACRDFGQRVQYSVFEIEVDPAQWTALKARLENIIDRDHDSLRYITSAQTGSDESSTSAPSPQSISAAR